MKSLNQNPQRSLPWSRGGNGPCFLSLQCFLTARFSAPRGFPKPSATPGCIRVLLVLHQGCFTLIFLSNPFVYSFCFHPAFESKQNAFYISCFKSICNKTSFSDFPLLVTQLIFGGRPRYSQKTFKMFLPMGNDTFLQNIPSCTKTDDV